MSCDLWAPSYPQESAAYRAREEGESINREVLELPRPMSPAIRIKVRPAESRGLKAGLERYCISGTITGGKYLASLTAKVLVR
jgi:hypothetical protein